MSGNIYGTLFRLTTFGESHGAAIGGIIDGCPPGLKIDENFVHAEMRRRRPGQSAITTNRKEEDKVEWLSGIFEGKSTGTPICFIIPSHDQRPGDYEAIKDKFRPSHADYTYTQKYGFRDYRGGGRASARETAARVAAGAIAKLYLKKYAIRCHAYVSQIGNINCEKSYLDMDLSLTEQSLVRCPDKMTSDKMIAAIEAAKKDGDSLGGIITGVITGQPAGLGEPVFDKLHAELGKAMLSINAVKGFDYGSGFAAPAMKGSTHNDEFITEKGHIATRTNFSGGIQGGISNGEDIYFRVAFKPVATIAKAQNTVGTAGNKTTIAAKGRHDPCVVPRAVVIVEAMAALVIADMLLRAMTNDK